MASDRLVVYVDHPNTGVHMNWTPVDLSKDDLTDKAVDIVIGIWGWTPEDMTVNGDKLNSFLIDPDLWKDVGKRIQWPDVSTELEENAKEIRIAVTRCKIKVYEAMKMHWSNDKVRAYARKSETHRAEILSMTRGDQR